MVYDQVHVSAYVWDTDDANNTHVPLSFHRLSIALILRTSCHSRANSPEGLLKSISFHSISLSLSLSSPFDRYKLVILANYLSSLVVLYCLLAFTKILLSTVSSCPPQCRHPFELVRSASGLARSLSHSLLFFVLKSPMLLMRPSYFNPTKDPLSPSVHASPQNVAISNVFKMALNFVTSLQLETLNYAGKEWRRKCVEIFKSVRQETKITAAAMSGTTEMRLSAGRILGSNSNARRNISKPFIASKQKLNASFYSHVRHISDVVVVVVVVVVQTYDIHVVLMLFERNCRRPRK